MRILMLTQILPYPPDAGPRVKTWHVLRYLAGRGHRVRLVSFVRPEEEPYLPVVREVCEDVVAVPLRRSRAADALHWARSHLAQRPFLLERDDQASMRRAVLQACAPGSVEILHADQLTMTQFTPPPESPALRIFDAHNATWMILERMRRTANRWLRPVLALEARRVRRYEGGVIRDFDQTMAVTTADREALLAAANDLDPARPVGREKVSVLPIAVDTKALETIACLPASTEILTLGTLHYAPNAEGIRWFVREVFPLVRREVPLATLTIAGRNPPADFHRLAQESGGAVRVVGYVDDLRPHLERAAVVAVPVLSGSGMRVRILESFARGMPVVTTTVGAEGLQARPGDDLLLGDSPQDYAAATVRLLREPGLRRRLAQNGRQLAVARYDWQVVLRGLEAVYETALRRRGAPASSREAVGHVW
jgi:glycosyltransferase involved in cell wall biosynthesis